MHRTHSIPELAQRDRFLRRTLDKQFVYAVLDDQDIVRLPSQKHSDREVVLLWSHKAAAERWADVLTETPTVAQFVIEELLADVLPGLAQDNVLLGLDWNANPIEGEFRPDEILDRLISEVLHDFIEASHQGQRIFILENKDGPALVGSEIAGGRQCMPVWSSRGEAEAHRTGAWSDMIALEIPLVNFRGLTLPWLVEHGYAVGPNPKPGMHPLELTPQDLDRWLTDRPAIAA